MLDTIEITDGIPPEPRAQIVRAYRQARSDIAPRLSLLCQSQNKLRAHAANRTSVLLEFDRELGNLAMRYYQAGWVTMDQVLRYFSRASSTHDALSPPTCKKRLKAMVRAGCLTRRKHPVREDDCDIFFFTFWRKVGNPTQEALSKQRERYLAKQRAVWRAKKAAVRDRERQRQAAWKAGRPVLGPPGVTSQEVVVASPCSFGAVLGLHYDLQPHGEPYKNLN